MDGLRIFHRFQIQVEAAIPAKKDCGSFSKLRHFLGETYPDLLSEVIRKRAIARS
jgi:hypothetical protein